MLYIDRSSERPLEEREQIAAEVKAFLPLIGNPVVINPPHFNGHWIIQVRFNGYSITIQKDGKRWRSFNKTVPNGFRGMDPTTPPCKSPAAQNAETRKAGLLIREQALSMPQLEPYVPSYMVDWPELSGQIMFRLGHYFFHLFKFYRPGWSTQATGYRIDLKTIDVLKRLSHLGESKPASVLSQSAYENAQAHLDNFLQNPSLSVAPWSAGRSVEMGLGVHNNDIPIAGLSSQLIEITLDQIYEAGVHRSRENTRVLSGRR